MKKFKSVLELVLVASIFLTLIVSTSMVASADTTITNENFQGETVDLSKWSKVTSTRGTADSFSVVPDPSDGTNKVMKLTVGSSVRTGNVSFIYDFVDVPGNGELFISYRIKTGDITNTVSTNYCNLFNITVNETVGGLAKASATTVFNNGLTGSTPNYARASGYKIDGTTVNVDFTSPFGNSWSSLQSVVDFSTQGVKYFRDGSTTAMNSATPIYLNGSFSSGSFNASKYNKASQLKFFFNMPASWTGADADFYIDDIVIKRVPVLTAETVAFDAQNVSPIQPSFSFNFSTPVANSALNSAFSIKKDGVAVTANKTVVLSTDRKTGTISFLDNLLSNTNYTLELDSSLVDIYGKTVSSGISIPFKTKNITLVEKEKIIISDNFDSIATDLSKWSMSLSNRMSIDSFAIVTDPLDTNNKVMRYRVTSTNRTTGSSILQYDFTDIPNKGKLMVSYRFRTGDITNPVSYAGYPSVFGLNVNETVGGTAYNGTGVINNLATTGRVGGQNNTTGAAANTNTPVFGNSWSTIKCVVDFSTQGVIYYRDGSSTAVNASNPTYLNWLNIPAGNTTFNASKYNKGSAIKMNFPVPTGWTAGDADFYVDDLTIKRVPALSVGIENQATNVEPILQPVTINLANPVTLSALTSALSLKIGETTVPVNITLSSDAKKATIIPVSGSLAGNTTYSLNIENTLTDIYGQALPTRYTTDFTTSQLANDINMKDTVLVSPTAGGVAVSLANATQVSVKYNLKNPTDALQNVIAIVAIYNSDKQIVGVNMLSEDVAAKTINPQSEIIVPNVSQASSVKVFLFNDLINIKPYQVAELYN